MIDRLRTNPISLRIWYPRLVEDASFARLLRQLQRIRADRVYLFDNGYMDNFQLAPVTLAERLPVLTKRIAQLRRAGLRAGINSGATVGHVGDMQGAERLLELDWWVARNGATLPGIACPLGRRFLRWMEAYFRGLAETGAQEIFIDDDFRLHNHGGPSRGDWGCFCDLHLAAMTKRTGRALSRAALAAEIARCAPGRISEEWIALWKANFRDLLARIEKVVHAVNPRIRLGLMPVQNFIRDFGEDFLREAIRVVSVGNRPLLRTHDYHGLPHELLPGSGLAAKRTAPPEAEHVVEIENLAHNVHECQRSPRTTRYAILSALAVGMGGAAPTFGDSERDMPWEQAYWDMFRANDRFFRAVANLTLRDTTLRGIPIRHRAYQRQVRYMDCRENVWSDALREHPDSLAAHFGVAYQWDAHPVWLLGELPSTLTREELAAVLNRGAVIDVAALRCLRRLGFARQLGVEAGDLVRYRRGHRFLPHPFNGTSGGDINALRAPFPVFRLIANPSRYEEVTEFVSWTGRRVAGGILVQKEGPGRNVILPHALSLVGDDATGIMNTQYRRLMRRLLAHCLGEPLKLRIETPPRLAPFYFERTDGAVIVTLLNGYYDDAHGFDLVFGDGARLARKKVYRVMPDGRIQRRPTLRLRAAADGACRLRIDSRNALKNCDVLTLLLAA